MKAIIDENKCIGCTKCISVCPVNAIVGAIRNMHTILSNICTGCDVCTKTCPTKAIKLRLNNQNE